MPALYPDIHANQRVTHANPRRDYGPGVVVDVNRSTRQAGVRFDGDADIASNPPPRTVWLKDLQPETVDAVPVAAKVVWPLDRAGEAVAS